MREYSSLVAVLLLSACASDVATRILPREDGTISAISVAREETGAAGANVEQANQYCEKQARRAVFLAEKTEYQGVLTKQGEAAARVIKKFPVFGEDMSSDDDFQVTTSFKCLPAE